MKKLLIMASLFWPQKKSGGPPTSIMNLVQSVKDQFDIYIISKNHEINETEPLPGIAPGWNSFDFGKAIYLSKEDHTFANVSRLIAEINPDTIYQNSFFSVDDLLPVLMHKKKHRNVKVIVAPRGEFYPERIRVGKLKKDVYCKLFRYSGMLRDVYFQGTGEEECRQEREILGIPHSHLLNIQNMSVMPKTDFLPLKKAEGAVRLVYIARIHPTKNTLKAIQWLQGVKGQVVYDIYGSVENPEYWKQCEEAIAALPENIQVSYHGVIDHEQVGETISRYHAYYMPTTGENYGHSIVEAMLIGKPVVISDQTPWTDVNGQGGYVAALENTEAFAHALQALVSMNDEMYCEQCEKICQYIKKKLNVEETVRAYISAFDTEE